MSHQDLSAEHHHRPWDTESRPSASSANGGHADHADLLEGILGRSTTDREFRAALIAEPKEAIYNAFGVRVPDRYRVRFLERDAGFDTVVVLPDFIDPEGGLTDDDLDVVHGGDGGNGGGGW